jgi:recombination protein RecR
MQMKFPASIQNLINFFSDLPTVGPKTAERYVFYLLKKNPEELQRFAQAIAELKEKTTVCSVCHAYAESNPCYLCSDKNRNPRLLCIVADTRGMMAIESTKEYSGLYHALGGVINAIEGSGPEELNIKSIIEKIKNIKIEEIVLALDPNFEGETTVMYLTKLLKPYKIKITRLAKGLPMGADLEYADEMTLANALKYRNEL